MQKSGQNPDFWTKLPAVAGLESRGTNYGLIGAGLFGVSLGAGTHESFVMYSM